MPDAVRGHGRRKRDYERDGRRWTSYGAWLDYGTDDYGKRRRVEKWFPRASERDEWLLSELAGDAAGSAARAAGRPSATC